MLLNLLQLLQSDDQTTYTDKVNYNFDQILSMGGGPIGPTGFNGIQGVPGNQGVQGFQGEPGLDGARWYVLPSSGTPSIPTPRINDLWLQTDTLRIFEYLGSPATWIDLGFSLSSTGVFKSGGASDLLFTSPNATRSLVLSPIDYGSGNDSPGSSYKLKIVGNSASPMLRFAIDDGGSENSIPAQATLGIQKITDPLYTTSAGINWRTNFDNNGGDFFLNTSGNYFAMYPQISSVGRFDFGSQTRLQNSATSRLLSFAASNTGTEFFNIGRHSAITNIQDNLFTINDKGQVGFNNTAGTVFTPINVVGATDFHIDVINEALGTTALAKNNWLRLRGKTRATWDTLQVDHNRLWADGVGNSRSAMIRLQHYTSAILNHFIGFTGGSDSNAQPTQRAQLRLGYGDNYYFSGDINGRIGIGDTAFIQKYNSLSGFNNFKSKLQIQGNDSLSGGANIQGAAAHSGIHLIPQNFANSVVGISSGGIGSNENITFGAIHFQDDSGAIDQGLNLNFSTGVYADGISKLRSTIFRHGDHFIWSKSNPYHFLNVEPGGYNPGGVLNPNDFIHIGSYDWTSSWKSIIFNKGTDTSGFGDGFIGIGGENGFGEDITSGSLEQNMWYVAKGSVVYFDGSSISVFNSIFKVVNAGATLTSGIVSRAKPVTKLHINGDAAAAITLGTRKGGTSLSTVAFNVGNLSLTVGNKHRAAGNRSVILGGFGHNAEGLDSIIIGYTPGKSISMSDPNIVHLASKTVISTTAYTNTSLPTTITNGNGMPVIIGVRPQYLTNFGPEPILNLSNEITSLPAGTGIEGYISRVLSLESRVPSINFNKILSSIEFKITNSVGVTQVPGMITANMDPTLYSLSQRSRISFHANLDGKLYETAFFNHSGLYFIPGIDDSGSTIKKKIAIEDTKDIQAPSGQSLFIQGGNANQGAGVVNVGVGGSVLIDGGAGVNGGDAGRVAIGFTNNTSIVSLGHLNIPVIVTGDAQIMQNVGPSGVRLSTGDWNGYQFFPGSGVGGSGGAGNIARIKAKLTSGWVILQSNGTQVTPVLDTIYNNFYGYYVNSVAQGPGTAIWDFEIMPETYDRMINWVGIGSWYSNSTFLEGSIWHCTKAQALTTTVPTFRFVENPYGGRSFVLPANTTAWVKFQVYGDSNGPMNNGGLLKADLKSGIFFNQIKLGQ